ncbi:hypothetical protein K1T71_013761 [Dendrolimus kikuchii]|uniref:Uncharacterized protein n=1 Tax=Dendrolimus kikuchii TaxID=765133 RepID=A0ACC1CHE2_9NEOP|nr:hypothetical protein K1T71_013761 [Dendrolimus kikuchii]
MKLSFFLLCILIYATVGDKRHPRNRLVTPFDRYHFEGVDVTEMPGPHFDIQHDCFGQHLRCIRHTTPLVWVCAFHIETGYFAQYLHECVIYFVNCRQRMERNKTVYGEWSDRDVAYYNGERGDCNEYTRRSRNIEEMVELYFSQDEQTKDRIMSRMSVVQRRSPPSFIDRRNIRPNDWKRDWQNNNKNHNQFRFQNYNSVQPYNMLAYRQMPMSLRIAVAEDSCEVEKKNRKLFSHHLAKFGKPNANNPTIEAYKWCSEMRYRVQYQHSCCQPIPPLWHEDGKQCNRVTSQYEAANASGTWKILPHARTAVAEQTVH